MRITEEQNAILDSLVVERLRDHLSENAALVNSFANVKNPVLENIIRTRVSFDSVQSIAGCQYVYLFAADASADGELVNYYKERLKFEQSAVLGANKPKYDFQCYFLYQSITELKTRRNQFYADFNADSGSAV